MSFASVMVGLVSLAASSKTGSRNSSQLLAREAKQREATDCPPEREGAGTPVWSCGQIGGFGFYCRAV